MKAVTAIKINAGNDVNGNPRRAYVVLSNGAIVEAIDEGYEGEAALRASYPHLHVSANIDVTPKEYRDMLKFHPSKGMKRNPLSAHAAAIMGNKSKTRIPGVKIVHNKLLGGWFIVRGPHQTPIGGRFDSKAEAEAHLMRKNPRAMFEMTPAQKRTDREAKDVYELQVKREDVFAQLGNATWITIGKYKSKNDAIKSGKAIHLKLPNAALRVI